MMPPPTVLDVRMICLEMAMKTEPQADTTLIEMAEKMEDFLLRPDTHTYPDQPDTSMATQFEKYRRQ